MDPLALACPRLGSTKVTWLPRSECKPAAASILFDRFMALSPIQSTPSHWMTQRPGVEIININETRE
jgi:hypothetical protein